MIVEAFEAGDGPWVLLRSVTCPECGPRLYTTIDDDPTQHRFYFPVIVRREFASSWGPCFTCKQQCLLEVEPCGDTMVIGEDYLDLTTGERHEVYQVLTTP